MQPTNKMIPYSQVLNLANERFANDKNKAAIINKIKNLLEVIQYDEAQKNNRRAEINFGWSYTGWAQDEEYLNSTEYEVKRSVKNFFDGLPYVNSSIDK